MAKVRVCTRHSAGALQYFFCDAVNLKPTQANSNLALLARILKLAAVGLRSSDRSAAVVSHSQNWVCHSDVAGAGLWGGEFASHIQWHLLSVAVFSEHLLNLSEETLPALHLLPPGPEVP